MIIILKRLGRWFDKSWRTYRPIFLPSFKQAYRDLKKKAVALPDNPNHPIALFDFQDNRVDGPQGRRFFNLATMARKSNYHIAFTDQPRFLANPRANFKARVFTYPFSIVNNKLLLLSTYKNIIVFTDRSATNHPLHSSGHTIVQVSLRLGPIEQKSEFAWPFPMFPDVYDKDLDSAVASLRQSKRTWTFFFGGRAAEHSYDKGWVDTVYHKVPRNRYLRIAEQTLAQLNIPLLQPSTGEKWQSRPKPNALFVRNEQCKLPLTDWLPTIAQAQFFLACPGVRYPMSHNVIESMAVGSVPIIEYPEDFFPPLADGQNCLTFKGEEELASTLERASKMPDTEWHRLSLGAIEYYEQHLSPTAAIQSVLNAAEQGQSVLRLVPYVKIGGGLV